MDQDDKCEGVVIAAPASLKRAGTKYGSVPGLSDDELADPDELERQIMVEEFGPVLTLPTRRKSTLRPDIDEDGVRCDAFSTVDFERTAPRFDRLQYRAEQLREELRTASISLDPLMLRLPRTPRRLVLRYLRQGIIDLAHIESMDMYLFAQRCLRIERIRRKIVQLVERRREHQRKARGEMFGTW